MGFLSKIWKGIKTGASGIVKGIKGVIKSFGKFMDDIGIVGQIAMSFILPAVGKALFEGMSGFIGQSAATSTQQATQLAAAETAGREAATAAATSGAEATVSQAAAIETGKKATATLADGVANKTFTKTIKEGVTSYTGNATGMFASENAITRGAAHIIGGSFEFASKASNVYGNISRGVTDFLGNVGKSFVNAFGGEYELAPIFGEGGRFEKFSNLTQDPNKFGKAIEKAVEETIDTPVAGTGTPPPVNVDAVNVGSEVTKDVSLLDNQTNIDPTTDLGSTPTAQKVATNIGQEQVVEDKGFFSQVATNIDTNIKDAYLGFRDDPVLTTIDVLGIDDAIKGATYQGLSRSIFGEPEPAQVFNTAIPNILGESPSISLAEQDMQIPDANAVLSATQNYGMYGSPAYMSQYIQQYAFPSYQGSGANLLASK